MKQFQALNIIRQVRAGYNRIAGHFSNTRRFPWKKMENIKAFVKDGDRVLDVGCGNGRLLDLLADKRIDYVGLDISDELIKLAKNKLIEEGHPREIEESERIYEQYQKYTIGKIKSVQFSHNDFVHDKFSGQFDIIFAIAFMHHIPSRDLRSQVAGKMHGLLQQNGMVLSTVWNLWQTKYMPKILFQNIFNLFYHLEINDIYLPWKNQDGELVAKRYLHAFTEKEHVDLFRNSGFVIKDDLQKVFDHDAFNYYAIGYKGKLGSRRANP